MVKLVVESSRGTLRLDIPLSEMSCVSRSLSDPPFRAPLKTPGELAKEEEKEEGLTESEMPSFHLTDFREILQVLDDFCEIRRLTELLPLRVHRGEVEMGNQQGVKEKPCSPGFSFNHDRFQKSGFQVPQTAEGTVPANNRIARSLLMPSKTSSPPQVFCTSVSRRTIRGPPELQPAWKARTDFPFKSDLSSKKGSSVILESSLSDSDTDLSEYDNENYSSTGKLENGRSTREGGRCPPADKKIQPGGDGDQAKPQGEEHTSPWTEEEMGNKAVAQRVKGKIEELEGIIRQVGLSPDWMVEGDHGRDEADLDGDDPRDNLECRKTFSKTTGRSDDKHHLIEEFQALGEALSQSLRQVLKMEAPKAEREASIKTQKITPEPNHSRSTTRIFPLLSHLLSNSGGDSSSSDHTGHQEGISNILEHGQKRVSQENLELREQDQASSGTSEIGDLLCSGNNLDLDYHTCLGNCWAVSGLSNIPLRQPGQEVLESSGKSVALRITFLLI